jgi:hypothetical protein
MLYAKVGHLQSPSEKSIPTELASMDNDPAVRQMGLRVRKDI